jgi:heptaprenyl diphosphate synthase
MGSIDSTSSIEIKNLSSYIGRIDIGIARAVESDSPHLTKQLSRVTKNMGKRLRPKILLALVAGLNNVVDDSVISSCVAVELVHMASLIHDDIIDESDFRHGAPTISNLEGINNAIVDGDYLLAKACLEGIKVNSEVGQKIAEAITRLCEGQSLEMNMKYDLNRTKSNYLETISGKTASLFAITCEIAGICSRLDKRSINHLKDYGHNFGMAFQVLDDLADLMSTTELLGKETGNDIKEGVYTLPIIIGLNSSQKESVKSFIKQSVSSHDKLNKLLVSSNAVSDSIEFVHECNKKAKESLSKLNKNKQLASLIEFPRNYENFITAKLLTLPDKALSI